MRFSKLPALILLCCALCACSRNATLKGRVFLVTEGGQPRGARLATVYLLDSTALPDTGTVASLRKKMDEDCPTSTYLSSEVPESVKRSVQQHYSDDLFQLMAQFQEHSRMRTQSDADGRFSFEHVPPGSYVITAFSRAGANLAYWQQPVTFRTSSEEINLSDPAAACLLTL